MVHCKTSAQRTLQFITRLLFNSQSKHALETQKQTSEEGQSQDVPLRCVPVAVCFCFYVPAMKKMNLGNSALEWICQKKVFLCATEKPVLSLERMPLMGKQSGMKKRTHQASIVGPICFWFSAGEERYW